MECPQGTCSQVEKLYDHVDKQKDKFINCLGFYMKKPGKFFTGIISGVLLLVIGSLCGSIYSGYKVFYALNTIPEVQAAEKENTERMFKIEKDQEVMLNIVKTIAETQKKFADNIDKNSKQLIEITTDLKHEKEQSRKINEQLIELLKKRQNRNE